MYMHANMVEWQTRTLEGRVRQLVLVQVQLFAPKESNPNQSVRVVFYQQKVFTKTKTYLATTNHKRAVFALSSLYFRENHTNFNKLCYNTFAGEKTYENIIIYSQD